MPVRPTPALEAEGGWREVGGEGREVSRREGRGGEEEGGEEEGEESLK